MAIHDSIARPRDESMPHRHLVALEQQQQQRRPTIYTDPLRAARFLKALIVTATIATTVVLAFTFGYDLLQFLGRVALVAILIALIALVVCLAADTMKGPRA